MKNLFLFSIVFLSGLAFGVPAHIDPALLETNKHKEIVASMIDAAEDTLQGGAPGRYSSEYLALELFNMLDMFYGGGAAKLETFNHFFCKIKEIQNVDKIISEMKPEERLVCGKNFYNQLIKTTCNKDLKFEDYFPETGVASSVFALKYKCDGKLHTPGSVIHNPYPTDERKQFYYMMYFQYLSDLVDKVKNNREEKVSQYQMASSKQCLPGLVRFPYAKFKPVNSCKRSGNTCERNEDCCSAHCFKTDNIDSGVCSQEVACYSLVSEGDTCGQLTPATYNPYCDNKEVRHAIDPLNNPQPQPGEKLTSCVETNFNTSGIDECTENGSTPTSDKLCCSNKVGAGGKCVEHFTCDICYKDGQVPENDKGCCPGYYKSLSGKCIQDFPPLTKKLESNEKKSLFNLIVSLFISSAHAIEPVSINEADSGDNTSGSSNVTGGAGVDGSGAGSTTSGENENTSSSVLDIEEKKEFDKDRAKCISNGGEQEVIDACVSQVSKKEADLVSKRLNDPNFNKNLISREDYKKAFNRAVIIEKKGSDFENCEFHSFNDNWNSGSDTYRNAELVLRGFEYVYSGDGTIDFWIDDKGKSIYERAQAVAFRIRENRRLLIESYNKIDREMKEECKEYFTQAKWKDENGAGTSSDDKAQRNADVDKGASGIKHTQMMVDFMRKRSEAQMAHFTHNAQAEEELQKLSDYISENKWEQSWTKVDNLYDFDIRWARGFWAFVFGVFVISIALALTPFTAGATLVAAILILTPSNSNTPAVGDFTADTLLNSMYQDVSRKVHDNVGERTSSGIFHWKKSVQRQYWSPQFITSDSRSEMQAGTGNLGNNPECNINASSRLCVKNVHLTSYENKVRFLLDVKFPEFLPAGTFEEDSGLMKKVNTAYVIGLQKLKNTYPGARTKPRFLDRDIINEFDIAKSFLPDSGNWKPKPVLANMKSIFVNAVSTYSKCMNLKECGAKHAKAGDYGFGHLISNDEDAKAFGDYVFQHHYIWPSISSNKFIGYPSMAQASYFETVSYYLKVVGSLASSNSKDYGDLADKYESHLNDLIGEYDVGGGAAQGRGSSNIEYSPEFRAKFGLLDFDTGAGADQFVGKDGSTEVPKGFNSAESTAFTAGVKKALRAKKQKEKADHFEKTVGKTKRGKLKKNAQGKFLKSFGRPIDNMTASLRKGLDAEARTASAKSSPSSGANGSQGENKASTLNTNAYQPPQLTGTNSYNYSSTSSENSDAISTNTGHKDAAKNKILLDSADKISRELKRDDSDSLFKIVTKAYFRNLDLILERTTSAKASIQSKKALEYKKKEDEISDDKRNELKKLLNE